MAFVNLHVHSAFSILDGFNLPNEIVEKAKEMEQRAVALTDHGAVHGFVELYKSAKEHGVKPIFGCEMYVVEDINNNQKQKYHVTLLAKNKEGLKNLYKLVTISNRDGFYYKPTIDLDHIKQHNEGIIGLSGCLGGEIPQAIINGYEPRIVVDKYMDAFEDFFLEIQPNKIEEQYKVNKELAHISDELQIPLVASNDTHYLSEQDAEYHDVLLAIQTKAKLADEDRMSFDGEEYYFKTEEEIRNDLFDEEGYERHIDEAIRNTIRISEMCEVELELGGFNLPNFEVPQGYSELEYMQKKCLDRLDKLDVDYDKYKTRLKEEFSIIHKKGFTSYFLIVADFMEWASDNDIVVGVGRGSAGGSLTSYLLGITQIDPIKNDLLFSRFLNEERDSNPDIDIDFAKKDREKVIDYVVEKYGKDSVARICTFGTMSARAVIKDVARALGFDFDYVNNKITKEISTGDSIADALEESEDLRLYKQKHPKLFEYAEALEGKPRHLGEHACAVVITPEPVVNYMPLAQAGGDLVTQFEMNNVEELGLLKMDFLGLKTLDIIDNTIEQIHKRDDLDKIQRKLGFVPETSNIWDMDLDDYKVYKGIFQEADSNGVFQMESRLFKQLLDKMQPKEFEHIVAILALGRPGTLDAGMDETYIDRMHGEEEVEYYHEDLKEVLEPTYGVILYQEQILKIAQIIAGYTLGEADILRRAVGKKKEKLMKEQKEKFINGAIDKGYSKELGEEMFELIDYFSNYGFNRSHSAAYAMISYVTAFLKYYFPAEFYASLISFEAEKTFSDSSIKEYIADCYGRKIKILPPDINYSKKKFVSQNGDILFGINIIKGVGEKAVEEIITNRPYEDLYDFVDKVDNRVVNKTVVESLIKGGAFDFVDDNRNDLLDKYLNDKNNNSNTMALFSESLETTKEEIIAYEQEVLNISLTYPNRWLMVSDNEPFSIEGEIVEISELKTKNDRDMAFIKIQTILTEIKCILFPRQYDAYINDIEVGDEILVDGKKNGNALQIRDIRWG